MFFVCWYCCCNCCFVYCFEPINTIFVDSVFYFIGLVITWMELKKGLSLSAFYNLHNWKKNELKNDLNHWVLRNISTRKSSRLYERCANIDWLGTFIAVPKYSLVTYCCLTGEIMICEAWTYYTFKSLCKFNVENMKYSSFNQCVTTLRKI